MTQIVINVVMIVEVYVHVPVFFADPNGAFPPFKSRLFLLLLRLYLCSF